MHLMQLYIIGEVFLTKLNQPTMNKMKIVFPLIFILFGISIAAAQKLSMESIMQGVYEQHFISSGDNFSQISLKKNKRYLFLVGLHNGIEPKDMQTSLQWNDSTFQREIELLTDNGYVKYKNGKYVASINIVMQEEGKQIFDHCEKVASQIVESIIEFEPTVKKLYYTMDVADKRSYEELSFFLLSDVLLDNWQINNVESEFLKKERPLRHGKRYYIQYAEIDTLSDREVFGIYGNQYTCNDSICFITYGNNRKNHHKSTKELLEMELPLISTKDQEILDKMANSYKSMLIEILEENREYFTEFYQGLDHKNETGFEEFFIWYYHFLYTRATDILADKGLLDVPQKGIFRVKLMK